MKSADIAYVFGFETVSHFKYLRPYIPPDIPFLSHRDVTTPE
jgi:hypothetical protein